MCGGHVPQRGFGLGVDELLHVFHGKSGFGGVCYLPHHNRADNHGVAIEVVDFDFVGFKVAHTYTDLFRVGQRRH